MNKETTPQQQQAEPPPEWPLIKNILDVFGLDAIAFVADWKAAQQQAEPMEWDKPSDNFNAWWDSYRHDGGNPFDTDSFAYWAFAGWKAALAQRPWQGLTKEYLAQIDTEEIYGVVGNHTAIAMAVEAKLKELNK